MIRRRFSSGESEFNPDKYLTIEALDDGLSITSTKIIYYRTIEGKWTSLLQNVPSPQINKGECLYIKAKWEDRSDLNKVFAISKKCKLKGNCMSLFFLDSADKNNDLSAYPRAFYRLFEHNTTILEVSPTFIPATTLARYCYSAMFQDCSSLAIAPELPATTLTEDCYDSMFNGCTSLVNAPELPATTLTEGCYRGMFQRCTSLVNAPELPATTLTEGCYRDMFQRCTKLNYIKAMFTTTPSSSYTSNWVNGVASSGTFVKNKNATWNVIGVNGVPSGWTIQKV
jgi:hypothetical protein